MEWDTDRYGEGILEQHIWWNYHTLSWVENVSIKRKIKIMSENFKRRDWSLYKISVTINKWREKKTDLWLNTILTFMGDVITGNFD